MHFGWGGRRGGADLLTKCTGEMALAIVLRSGDFLYSTLLLRSCDKRSLLLFVAIYTVRVCMRAYFGVLVCCLFTLAFTFYSAKREWKKWSFPAERITSTHTSAYIHTPSPQWLVQSGNKNKRRMNYRINYEWWTSFEGIKMNMKFFLWSGQGSVSDEEKRRT